LPLLSKAHASVFE